MNFGPLSKIPVIGQLLFQYNWLVYLSIILAIAMAWFLNKTRTGLNLRAVGESPATADAAGLNVTKYKYALRLSAAVSAVLQVCISPWLPAPAYGFTTA